MFLEKSNLQSNFIEITLRSAWVFSCKFTAYFQYKFSQEHFWRVTSVETDTYRNKAIKDDGNAYIDIDDDDK